MLQTLKMKVILVVLLLSGMMGSCVKKEFDKPPIGSLPVGEVKTIAELIEMYNTSGATQIDYDASLYAVVTMDETSGNIYKSAYVKDPSGFINLRFTGESGLRTGDSIRVYLKKAILNDYNSLYQIDNLNADSNVVILANQKYPTPEVMTIGQILAGGQQSKLVILDSVQFISSDLGFNFSEETSTTNRTIEDCNGKSILVRTSNYANFADKPLPQGKGSLVAIVGQFGNTYQLYIRTLAEVFMTGERCTGGGGGGGEGGTKENPFTVAQAIENQNATPYVVSWVKGFIVGSVKEGITAITSAADIHFVPPFTLATNVLLADDINETDYTKCVIVNLPAGSPLRTQVNLLDNAVNHKKWLNVTGTLRTYFGVAGLRDCPGLETDFELEGGGGGGGDALFTEDFATTLGTFSHISVVGDQIWNWGTFDGGCVLMTGYANPDRIPNEDWLISPAINLATNTGSVLEVRQAANYVENQWDLLQVMISSDYDGSSNPNSQGTWTELTIPNRPPGTNWTFLNSGEIDISSYDGQSTVYIAFRYRSTDTVASTWEISKVEVK